MAARKDRFCRLSKPGSRGSVAVRSGTVLALTVAGLAGLAGAAAGQEPEGGDRAAVEAADSTATLRGRVVDTRTLEPAGAARVVVKWRDRTAVADGEGRFRFDGLDPGRVTLEVTYLDWPPLEREVPLPTGGTVEVRLEIGPEVVHLDELEITVTDRPDGPLEWFAHRVDRGWGKVIGRAELEASGSELSWLVRRHVRRGPGAAGSLAHGLRGRLPRRDCSVRYYVNGRRAPWLSSASLPFGSGPADYFRTSEISAVEIYNPPQIPPSLSRGSYRDCNPVVVLWEKEYVGGR